MFLFIFWLHIQKHNKGQANNRMDRKQEEMFSFRCGRKTPNGANPWNQVGTEHPIHIQGSGLKWESN